MSQEAQLAIRVLWPAVAVAAAVMLAAWWPWSRRGSLYGGHWGGAVACGLGFSVGFLVLTKGWPGVPPQERWQWLLLIGLGATVIGLMDAMLRPTATGRLAFGVALAVVTATFLHPPPAFAAIAWKAALGVLVLATFLALEPVADRRPGSLIGLVLCIVFAGASMVIVQSRSAVLGLAAAAASATYGVCFAFGVINPRLRLSHGAIHVASALLPAMAISGWFYNFGDVGMTSFILLVTAPPMLWLGELGPVRRMKPWQAASLSLLAVLIIVALAVALAVAAGASAE
ncbi:MAG: hypothetical protein L0Y44_07255 [Phycisphaerales bacterium]|nr:hypothetical protein [Phycisphaerales bacterium]MCI0630437.1 hypothetical protein [Phycisphaerales bacterium]MCI0676373.1 hypothetical protein [Phycisphaerales bacterium]